MKKIALAAAAASMMFAGAASAADMAPRYTKAPPPVPVAVYSWTGCYIGGNVGWTQAQMDGSWLANPLGYPASGPAVNASSLNRLTGDSVIGGGQIGCNWQSGNWVIGIEGDIQGLDAKNTTIVAVPTGTFTNEQSFKIDWLSTIRGKAGVTVGANNAWLLYVTGGAAVANVSTRDCELHGIATTSCNITLGNYNLVDSSTTRWGWTAGVGAEYKLTQNWSVKGEYLYVGLGNITTVSQSTPFIANNDITHYHRNIHLNVARVGVNYQFGGPVVAKY